MGNNLRLPQPPRYVHTLKKEEKTASHIMKDSRRNPTIAALVKMINRLDEGDGVFVPEDVLPVAQVRARVHYYYKLKREINVCISCQKQEGGVLVYRYPNTGKIDWDAIDAYVAAQDDDDD